MPIAQEAYGKTEDGNDVIRYILKNSNNYEVRIINYGASITHIYAPDKNGKIDDIVLGCDSYEECVKNDQYFGPVVGRYVNRIGGAQFSIDGVTYKLDANDNGINAAHGGKTGFCKRLWTGEVQGDKVVMTYVSADGEEGYPGELTTTVSFQLTSDNKLVVNMMATTNKPTVLNLTNHIHFNLGGHNSGTIEDHVLKINADHFLPTDDKLIPLGKLAPVEGPMDLRKDTELGPRLKQVKLPDGYGYDHNFCIGKAGSMKHMARLFHPATGRCMNIHSTEPGLQCYSGVFLNNVKGKSGAVYNKYGSLCLEAQHYPDSPNQDSFPSVILRPEETYMQNTVWEFSVEK